MAEDDTSPEWSDEELTELALSADPNMVIPDDAVPFDARAAFAGELLPAWYMPPPSLRRTPRRTFVLASVAISLFVINVAGVCVTYGIPDPVWK